MAGHLALGRAGEDLAARHLERVGYRVLARNWRCPHGEIDIVARHDVDGRDELVICEVKTRRSDRYGHPCEAVDARRRRRLRAAAVALLADRTVVGGHVDVVRFDVVEVLVRRGTAVVTVIADAF
jgi:putative endonuclease